jgi:hypothetical protein
MPRGNHRFVAAALMALVCFVETAVAKDAKGSPSRRPSSLSALSANKSKPHQRDFRRIGDRNLPSGGATEALLADDSVNRSPQSSGTLPRPRITLPQERTMPRQGTLSPQFNYTDVNIQFR